ncbi:MAG TPA: GYF domain-containing protein [Verrucomicrobiae bacterium]
MANYTVIGGDGKEYGPISDGDLRKWIAEGRLNAQSLVKAESDAEFRPLATFPEIADVFGAAAPPPGIAPVLAGGIDRNTASDKVRVPAIGLIVSSALSFVMSLYGLATIRSIGAQMQQINSMMSQAGNPQAQQFMDTIVKFFSGPFGIANYLFQILIEVLIFIGALKMLKLRSYEFSYAAAILAIIPCITPCCGGWILGVIFGIWAMSIMGKVKQYFS